MGFELGIHNAYRSTFGRSQEDSEGDKGQGLLTEEGQNSSSENRRDSERSSNWLDKRPLCVGYSEIDKYADAVFKYQFQGVPSYGDITKINAEELPDFDCLVGGFPCQAFSIAGKRKGFEDTRGTLFFDLARILRAKQPRLFVFENVKGLLSHDSGNTFKTIIATIDELGYDAQWQVVNSKNFGVPQNRERVIIVGHLRGTGRPEVFPIGGDNSETTNPASGKGQIVDLSFRADGGYKVRKDERAGTLDANYYKGIANQERPGVIVGTLRTHNDGNGFREVKSGMSPTIPARAREDGSGQPVIIAQRGRGEPPIQTAELRPDENTNSITTVQKDNMVLTGQPKYVDGTRTVDYTLSDEAPTIRATQYKNGDNQPKVIGGMQKHQSPREDGISPTLTSAMGQGGGQTPMIWGDDVKIRRLTPVECERLQAFPDNWTKIGLLPCKTPTSCPYPTRKMCSGHETVMSDTQRYKMCGNAVTTNVIQAVFERIFQ